MTEEEFDALPLAEIYRRSGVRPEDVINGPDGAYITVDAVRRLAAKVPDRERAEEFIDFLDNELLPRFRPN